MCTVYRRKWENNVSFIDLLTVGVLDIQSMSFNKRDRSISIEEEPSVSAILQSGGILNSIDTDDNSKKDFDELESPEIFPIGYGEHKTQLFKSCNEIFGGLQVFLIFLNLLAT